MLTDKNIQGAMPKDQPFILWDSELKGFGCRVFPKGKKSFVIMYRVNGKLKLVKLAMVGDVTLHAARKRAATELAKVRLGQEDIATRRHEERKAPTFADLWARFETDFAPNLIKLDRMKERTLMEYRKIIRRHVLPWLGEKKVKDIARADIERTAKRMMHISTSRNRALAVLSRLMNLAETWELRPQHSNPVKGIMRARETARDRVLGESEMQRLNAALLNLEGQHLFEVRAIVVAALTGLRISEALSLHWSNVNLETSRAVLPVTKTGKRTLILAGPVKAILEDLPRVNDSEWVFPSHYTRRGACAVTYKSTRKVFEQACHAAGLEDVRLHDLRRSFATHLAARGVSAFLLRDTLGHKTLAMSNRYVQQASDALSDTAEQGAALIAGLLEKKV
ncbi:MAG: tyrosine-type recombinase/integrase [Nitrospira sp. SB0662_bin_26]|nr:tyrosine-type recombinase/integrase [Nitrospira sp. SB0662_bin_26]